MYTLALERFHNLLYMMHSDCWSGGSFWVCEKECVFISGIGNTAVSDWHFQAGDPVC